MEYVPESLEIIKERVIQHIINNIEPIEASSRYCSAACPYMDDYYHCTFAGQELLTYSTNNGYMRTLSCLTLKPILNNNKILDEFTNKILNSQKQNDVDVDIESIIFEEELARQEEERRLEREEKYLEQLREEELERRRLNNLRKQKEGSYEF